MLLREHKFLGSNQHIFAVNTTKFITKVKNNFIFYTSFFTLYYKSAFITG